MIDKDGIDGHQTFINNVITRIMSKCDPDEECVQLYSLRENLLYEDRALSATLLNSAIKHLQLIAVDEDDYIMDHKMKAVQSLNKAIAQLPMVAI